MAEAYFCLYRTVFWAKLNWGATAFILFLLLITIKTSSSKRLNWLLIERKSQKAAKTAALQERLFPCFRKTYAWLEKRLEVVKSKFEELDEAAISLTERLEQHKQMLALQAHQDQVWVSLLEDKFTTEETNLFFTYVADTLNCCHSHVVKKLPDLAPSLPTTACILRRKIKNRRINVAWESALRDLGLENSDVKALCAFFVTHGYQAEYFSPVQRQNLAEDVDTLIRKVVRNQVLRDSLLRAVQVVEKGKAGAIVLTTEKHKPASSIKEHFANQVTQ